MRHQSTTAKIVAGNLALEAELARIVQAFERENVECVVLKGTPLMRRLGEPLASRIVADNDLLVREGKTTAAERVLVGLGYSAAGARKLAVSMASGGGQHAASRVVGGVRFAVDLHWNAFHPPFRRVPTGLVWERTERGTLGHVPIRVLDRPMTLLHTAAHFVWHAMGQPRLLRTLGAAWDLWRDNLDIDDLLRLAVLTGTLPAFEFSLNAAQQLGYARTALPRTSVRASLALRLLPPQDLILSRPVPDYERIALSLLLVSTDRAAEHVLRFAVPTPGQASVLANSSAPGRIAHTYLRRPLHALQRWTDYRKALSRRRSEPFPTPDTLSRLPEQRTPAPQNDR